MASLLELPTTCYITTLSEAEYTWATTVTNCLWGLYTMNIHTPTRYEWFFFPLLGLAKKLTYTRVCCRGMWSHKWNAWDNFCHSLLWRYNCSHVCMCFLHTRAEKYSGHLIQHSSGSIMTLVSIMSVQISRMFWSSRILTSSYQHMTHNNFYPFAF